LYLPWTKADVDLIYYALVKQLKVLVSRGALVPDRRKFGSSNIRGVQNEPERTFTTPPVPTQRSS